MNTMMRRTAVAEKPFQIFSIIQLAWQCSNAFLRCWIEAVIKAVRFLPFPWLRARVEGDQIRMAYSSDKFLMQT